VTKIEWTHPPGHKGETLNPVVGCRPIGTGCLNCYAATLVGVRHQHNPKLPKYHGRGLTVLNNERHVFSGKIVLDREVALKPLRWRDPRCVFIASMGDLFYGNEADRRAWTAAGRDGKEFDEELLELTKIVALVFAVAIECPQHRFLLLTKRPDRAAALLNDPEFRRRVGSWLKCNFGQKFGGTIIDCVEYSGPWPVANVAIGCSVSTQKDADENIPYLLACAAAMRFVSYEPAVEAVDFRALNDGKVDALAGAKLRRMGEHNAAGEWDEGDYWMPASARLDWLIVGGESGPKARPFDLDWARSAIKQCAQAKVACFVKQLGAEPEGEFVKCPHCGHIDEVEAFDALGADPGNVFCIKCGKPEFSIERCEHTFQDRHGGDWDEWPEDLRVREWPMPFFGVQAC
jgi:protein gp37